jgi:hypothetical protein
LYTFCAAVRRTLFLAINASNRTATALLFQFVNVARKKARATLAPQSCSDKEQSFRSREAAPTLGVLNQLQESMSRDKKREDEYGITL